MMWYFEDQLLLLAGNFQGGYWIRQWSQLSKEEERGTLIEGCRRLEGVALHFFGDHVWRNQRRIGL